MMSCVVFALLLACGLQLGHAVPVYRAVANVSSFEDYQAAVNVSSDGDYQAAANVSSDAEFYAEELANKTPYGLHGYGPNEDELGDLFEGDIAGVKASRFKYTADYIRNVIKDPERRWPKAEVPYEIDTRVFQSDDFETIKAAMSEIEQRTCVRFVERESQRDYVYVTAKSGCFSSIGRTGGKQDLSLQTPGCMRTGTAVHEFLHALGIWHEQSRYDRDDYITINWSNIVSGMKSNFEKLDVDEAQTFGQKYDYGSIMHYSAYSFAMNSRIPTIVPKENGATIGQREHMSEIDSAKINSLYECKKALLQDSIDA